MRIGFIGVGVMGNGMVKNLLSHGYEVNAYTRTRAKALEALEAGAEWRESVADCVRDADAIITMVGFPPDVEEVYFGEKGTREGARGREGYDVECYSEFEVERVARHAFRLAQGRRKSVTSIDKSNALESSRLWRETVARVAQDYPDVQLTNLLVDKAAMELTCNPSRFDVMLTTSIFGDILSDEAGVATGSVGMLASAAINENGFGLFEPIHGTAPDIAGLGIANPLAAIAWAGMLLEIGQGLKEEAAAIDRAINEVLHRNWSSPDIYLEGRGLTKVTTEEMGRLTAEHIHR